MHKVHIVGNPNSGKTTLFNSLTKSSEHIGNWHGVTVDKASKIIDFNSKNIKYENRNQDKIYEIVDLPGLYSLNAFSLEEKISINEIMSSECKNILYLIDANNFKRSMLLALNLLIIGKNIKILINNYKFFEKNGGKIDIEYLNKILGCEIEIIDAQRIKPNVEFFSFQTTKTAFITTLKNQLNNIDRDLKNKLFDRDENKSVINSNVNERDVDLQCNKIQFIYDYINKIADKCISYNSKKIYGYSRHDNAILKLSVFLPSFIVLMFLIIYFTFFLVGPVLSDIFIQGLYYIIQKPIISVLTLATKSRFIVSLFNEGIFGACFSVLGFLPQICLMYVFLSILENSGLISRMAFLLDDMLQKVGLNGKIVYTMLMGFGCSTTASLSAKNMTDRNSQIKASLLTPFMSCSAKLPIYITVALALFDIRGIWLIFGLYILGIVMALVLAIIFEKTILPSRDNQFIIEFPPLKFPNLRNVLFNIKTSCKNFVIKVFGVIFGISIVLWLLTNVNIKFQYVGESSKSILYSFSMMISWMFKPIGLDNPNIICALIIGLVAKELILSSFAISNHITNLALLGSSLVISSNPINFTTTTGITFLIFTLLYFPCVSNFAVLLKEVGFKYTLLGVAIQLGFAYSVSYVVYQLLTNGLANILLLLVVILIIFIATKIITNKIKNKRILCSCENCNKCKINK